MLTAATPTQTDLRCYLYPVRLIFPDGSDFEVLAAEMPLSGQTIGCLIGRDVLARCVFTYDGPANQFSLSF
jgi:hypothetical protein